MKLLKDVSELEFMCPEADSMRTALVLIASTNCGVCAGFKPIYESLERKIGNCCDFYVAIAEDMGGRPVLREAFRRQFERKYNGFPSLFVILSGGALLEIPYGTAMWNEKTGNFDENLILNFLEKNKIIQKMEDSL